MSSFPKINKLNKIRRTHSEEKLLIQTEDKVNLERSDTAVDFYKASSKVKRAATSKKQGTSTSAEELGGRVAAYCTAESYEIDSLFSFLSRKFNANPTLYREVVYMAYEDHSDVFIFPYGVIIMWGLDISSEREILSQLKEFRIKPSEEIEYDDFDFHYGEITKIEKDDIILGRDADVLTRLAFSHGIAQSVKLSTFETNIEKLIEDTKELPQQLAEFGKIHLSRPDISKLMGKLFLHKAQVNLHSDILDVPDFFWEYSDLERLYRLAATYLDKEQRVEVLNKRLIVVEELLEMLRSELHSKNESKLEWIVIILIIVEVILELVDVLLVKFLQ